MVILSWIAYLTAASAAYSQTIPLDEAVRLSEMGPQSFNTIHYIVELLVNATTIYLLVKVALVLMKREYFEASKLLLITIVVSASEKIVVELINL